MTPEPEGAVGAVAQRLREIRERLACNRSAGNVEGNYLSEVSWLLDLVATLQQQQDELRTCCEDLLKVVAVYGYQGGSAQRAKAALTGRAPASVPEPRE